jgi:quercetin dioxygenase-like cupin family protein
MGAPTTEPRVDVPYPGIRRRTFDTAQATIAEYAFAPGATFPLHRHPHEQITVVREGSLELTVGGRVTELAPGQWSAIPGHEEHGITAGDDGASFLAILVPRREPHEEVTLTEPAWRPSSS